MVERFFSSLRNTLYVGVLFHPSRAAQFLRKRLINTSCHIDTGVVITNWSNFSSGIDCAIYHSTYVLNNSGALQIGNHSHLGSFCYVNVNYGSVTLGNWVAVGPHTSIISYSNHYEKGQKVTDKRLVKDVSIGSNVFIGANCTVLPGTTIHDNVVVGAGSVVKGTLEGNSIYAGVPCKRIRSGWYT